MRIHAAARIAGTLSIALLGFAPGARAATVTLDYDAGPAGDFRTADYIEKGLTTSVVHGHYEFIADATATGEGADLDKVFNLDEQRPGPGPADYSEIRIAAYPATTFDALQLKVVNPADAPGDFTISAIGGTGSISAPTTTGTLTFAPGSGFDGIVGLVIKQNSPHPGAFAFDDLQLRVLPEPAATASLFAAGLAVFALSRTRAR